MLLWSVLCLLDNVYSIRLNVMVCQIEIDLDRGLVKHRLNYFILKKSSVKCEHPDKSGCVDFFSAVQEIAVTGLCQFSFFSVVVVFSSLEEVLVLIS